MIKTFYNYIKNYYDEKEKKVQLIEFGFILKNLTKASNAIELNCGFYTKVTNNDIIAKIPPIIPTNKEYFPSLDEVINSA